MRRYNRIKYLLFNKYILPVYHYFVIRPNQKKLKKATKKEWDDLQRAIQGGNREEISKAGGRWNSALAKYRQQHPGG